MFDFSEPKIDRYQGEDGPKVRGEIRVTRADTGEPIATLLTHWDGQTVTSDEQAAEHARWFIRNNLVGILNATEAWETPNLSVDD